MNRRQVLCGLGAAALVPLVGCGTASNAKTRAAGLCQPTPEESVGSYAGDGSDGVNALTMRGIVRGDIRPGLRTTSRVADGVPLTLALTLTGAGCAPLAGRAVYVWHCDREGKYSLYSLPAESYLRGVQASDAQGGATFVTVFPGCESGRMPHIFCAVYSSVDAIAVATNQVLTTQIALPAEVCAEVYRGDGYALSAAHFAAASFQKDPAFKDGTDGQLAAVSGNVTEGFVAKVTVVVEG